MACSSCKKVKSTSTKQVKKNLIKSEGREVVINGKTYIVYDGNQ